MCATHFLIGKNHEKIFCWANKQRSSLTCSAQSTSRTGSTPDLLYLANRVLWLIAPEPEVGNTRLIGSVLVGLTWYLIWLGREQGLTKKQALFHQRKQLAYCVWRYQRPRALSLGSGVVNWIALLTGFCWEESDVVLPLSVLPHNPHCGNFGCLVLTIHSYRGYTNCGV